MDAQVIDRMKMNKRGQITIFIILALIIVVVILMFFFWKTESIRIVEIIDENDPQGSIETCARAAVEEAVERIGIHGGSVIPSFSVEYQNDLIDYACFSGEFYKPCALEKPMLVEHIEDEINQFIDPKIRDCFGRLKMKLSERSEVTDNGNLKITTRLFPKHMSVRIENDFQIKRDDRTINFRNFGVNIEYPMFEFAEIATEIANQQAKYCYFDSLGYMILRTEFDINETINGDSDKVYVIKQRATNHSYQLGVRSCPLPPGY